MQVPAAQTMARVATRPPAGAMVHGSELTLRREPLFPDAVVCAVMQRT